MKIRIRFEISIVSLIIIISCNKDVDNIIHQDIVFNPNITYSSVIDIDNNEYKTVKIGNQIWMAENLRVSHYNNGDEIPTVSDSKIWSNLTYGASCIYNNIEDNVLIYGRLYNYYTLEDKRNMCPIGWHIPTGDEWRTLIAYLGNEYMAGGELKETGTTHWLFPNTGATNITGFTALPGGVRTDEGYFFHQCDNGYWWSSEEHSEQSIWLRMMFNDNDIVETMAVSKKAGVSVRCLKNNE